MEVKKNIIFGVLNWGLGHATRSVPVIQKLIDLGFNPIIASDGNALSYLKKEFPQLKWEEIASYNIQYKYKNLFFQALFLAPRIASAIKKEQKQLRVLVNKYQPLAIISDNRLGFHSNEIPCAYISHQNKIIAPFPFSFANKIHHHFIQKFSQFWIPDFEKTPGLSGDLGHNGRAGSRLKFIGPLSRFANHQKRESLKVYDLTAILSGPEPQRTKLEESLVSQLKTLSGNFLVIRGTEGVNPNQNIKNIEFRNLVLGAELPELIERSKLVLSRSGYSSIMDYYFLENKAILIPTPGQSEQIYLANSLKKSNVFYSVNQERLELNNDLKEAMNFSGFKKGSDVDEDLLSAALLSLFHGK